MEDTKSLLRAYMKACLLTMCIVTVILNLVPIITYNKQQPTVYTRVDISAKPEPQVLRREKANVKFKHQPTSVIRNNDLDKRIDESNKAKKKAELERKKKEQAQANKKPNVNKNNNLVAFKINNYVGAPIGTRALPSSISQYNKIINYWADYYKVNADLVRAIIAQESSGNAKESNGSGWGLMQIEDTLMSEFKAFGRKMYGEEWDIYDRLDPNKNIAFGTFKLRSNLDHYGGDYMKAIQAYNFSHYSLDKLIKQFGPNWYNHRDEMAYYNGHYNKTKSSKYGDPNYIENVLKFLQ